MNVALVSFSTRPGFGGEGGVGWGFLQAASDALAARNERGFILTDQRDQGALEALEDQFPAVTNIPVEVPRFATLKDRDSRSRASYMVWRRAAARAMDRLNLEYGITHVHQVTFATATLPPVRVPASARHIWGPVNMAEPQRRLWNPREAIRINALREARRADRLVANNEQAAAAFSLAGLASEVEPNIIVEPAEEIETFEEDLLSIAGLLIERKRPWLAIQALTDPRLRQHRLQVIGDGPLLGRLQNLAYEEGVASRVEFTGRLPRDAAVWRLGLSRALIHTSAREGSPWVVGEAAAYGVPAVVFSGTGADTTARLSDNGSFICDGGAENLPTEIARGLEVVLAGLKPPPTSRWSARRLPGLLREWWWA